MSATVIPFPLARRRSMIARQSRYAAELNPDSAERFIRQQLRIQGDNMRRRGVPDDQIAHELQGMEAAIRHELQASVSTGGACCIDVRELLGVGLRAK